MNRISHLAPVAVRFQNMLEPSCVPETGQVYPHSVIFQQIAAIVSEQQRLEDR
jgi:hypothetical protein